MKILSLIWLLFVLTLNISAQTPNNIVGKWKIISVDDGVYYNYKTDSSAITKKLRDSLVGKKDSAISVEMLSMFVHQYEDYYFTFDAKLNYQEIRSGMVRVNGTYKIDASSNSIELFYGIGENKKPRTCKYKFYNDNLKFFISSPFGDEIELTLERTP